MSNLIGQKYTISTTNETHVEAYLINASDNEIESKKNAFVEACKKELADEKNKHESDVEKDIIVEDDVWLRVQSWGRTYYINFEDFVEYNNASIFNSADVFFVNQ